MSAVKPAADHQRAAGTGDPSTAPSPAAADDLEPQLKYERLGADVKTILEDASATALCLSEKVLALGTSAGNIHILDYSGNEVKRFSLHSKAVRHISFDDKAEYVASCCGENYVSISGLYTDDTHKFTFKRAITVVTLDPRYSSRKTREFVTGDVRGRLKLSSQGWLGRSDTVLHQGEGPIRAVTWHGSNLVWASDVGVKVYDTNHHIVIGSIPRSKHGRFADCSDCRLYVHQGADLYIAWPDCIQVAKILTSTDPVSGALNKRLKIFNTVPTEFFCLGAVPHNGDLAVLAYVTDADPDQDQVGSGAEDDDLAAAAAAVDAQQQQQQQSQPADEISDSAAAAAAAAGSGADAVDAADPEAVSAAAGEPDGTAVVDETTEPPPPAAAAAEPTHDKPAAAAAGPINIPQPVRRPQRAANAIVHSPGGPSLLEAAAAAAVAHAKADAAAAAAAAAAGDLAAEGTASKPAVSSSSSGSPIKTLSMKALPRASSGRAAAAAAAAAAGTEGSAAKPPRGWTRSTSFTSSGRSSESAAATEYVPDAYIPAGTPLRPELRILSLKDYNESAGHQHGPGAPPASCCFEKASDALTVTGYSAFLPRDYLLVPSYGNDFALMNSAAAAAGGARQKSRPSSGSRAPAQAQQQQQERSTAPAADETSRSDTLASAASGTADDVGSTAVAAAAAEVSARPSDAGSTAVAAAAAVPDEPGSEVIEDYGEFMYFIVSPKDIVVGRHRDTEDRISWFLGAGRFEAALAVAEADRSLPTAMRDAVVQAYLEYLTAAGKWSAAAAALPQLLRDQSTLWERWVFTFAQARELPLLGPVLPTKQPLLHSHCYNLVLQALLVDPAHHGQLLHLLQTWPTRCFNANQLIDAIAQRVQRSGGDSVELWQSLALLYRSQGRADLSLAVYLQLRSEYVFEFIQEHSLLSYLDEKAYLLLDIDEAKALELLAGHLDALPPGAVVPGLLDAMAAAEAEGDAENHETWRRRLFNYLDKVFQADPAAAGEYAELCVHLYADYCPARLMDFLQGSQTYPLEAALEVAEQQGMVDEQVYILSRMGNCRAALALIIERLQDVPRAIEFVRLQRDDELIEELIDWALRSADTTGQLLDHIGGNINPLRVIQKIPEGLEVDKLRDRLRNIIADFRTQTSLREGCNAILRSDCLHLVHRLQLEVKRALPVVWVQRIGAHGAGPTGMQLAAAAAAAAEGAPGADSHAQPPGSSHSRHASGSGAAVDQQQQQQQAGKTSMGGAATGWGLGSVSGAADSSPIKPQRLAAKTAASFLPAAAPAGKGPQWLKYSSGSGQAMAVVNSQDMPVAAMLESSSRVASPWGGASAAVSTASQQPAKVWIGSMQASTEATSILQANDATAGTDQQQQHFVAGSSTSGSRRSSKHQKQRSMPQATLPSLVAV